MVGGKRIAIVGSGISGLTAAYKLCDNYNITLFESNSFLGGHTNTIDVCVEGTYYSIDTGFIVFNDRNYPRFTSLLDELSVETIPSNMSFSFSSRILNLEYSGDSFSSLFAQRKNLFSLKFYRLLLDVMSFNKQARMALKKIDLDITIDQFTATNNFGEYFINCYLRPLASAIWSTPLSKVDQMPARFIFEFYKQHGLLSVVSRPQWYVIKNGSRSYIKPLIEKFRDSIRLNEAVFNVKRSKTEVVVDTSKGSYTFDKVIFACHSDQVLPILDSPTDVEVNILSNIEYIPNKATLHTDIKALPDSRKAWASWNYMESSSGERSLTYYMNKLQSISSCHNFCVSINNSDIDSNKIIKEINYSHPLYTRDSVAAKKNHFLINGMNNTYFVGAYWGNGFHEDGVSSSINALQGLGVTDFV